VLDCRCRDSLAVAVYEAGWVPVRFAVSSGFDDFKRLLGGLNPPGVSGGSIC
jgi:hypothetical protein